MAKPNKAIIKEINDLIDNLGGTPEARTTVYHEIISLAGKARNEDRVISYTGFKNLFQKLRWRIGDKIPALLHEEIVQPDKEPAAAADKAEASGQAAEMKALRAELKAWEAARAKFDAVAETMKGNMTKSERVEAGFANAEAPKPKKKARAEPSWTARQKKKKVPEHHSSLGSNIGHSFGNAARSVGSKIVAVGALAVPGGIAWYLSEPEARTQLPPDQAQQYAQMVEEGQEDCKNKNTMYPANIVDGTVVLVPEAYLQILKAEPDSLTPEKVARILGMNPEEVRNGATLFHLPTAKALRKDREEAAQVTISELGQMFCDGYDLAEKGVAVTYADLTGKAGQEKADFLEAARDISRASNNVPTPMASNAKGKCRGVIVPSFMTFATYLERAKGPPALLPHMTEKMAKDHERRRAERNRQYVEDPPATGAGGAFVSALSSESKPAPGTDVASRGTER